MTDIRGIIFDKDGTLFDFTRTWGEWARRVIEDLSAGDADLARELARILGFDRENGTFDPASMVIAETADSVMQALLPLLPGRDPGSLLDRLNQLSGEVDPAPATDLVAVLTQLRFPADAAPRRIGLATNDAEEPAHRHLRSAGVDDLFDFVVGYDSGFGGKPEAGQLIAFATQMALAPASVAMVGDSRHDLDAARAAGMMAVAVLTGVALAEELAPHADVVLPDISHLPEWLAGQAGRPRRA
jgi:phosphoglycolate phosphatase